MKSKVTGLGFIMVAAMALLSSIVVPAAQAYPPMYANCATGYACIWQDTSYTGRHYWKQSANAQPTPAAMNNQASSAAANGGHCGMTRFYDAESGSNDGAYFDLFSRSVYPDRYFEDPDLSNGAGVNGKSSQNWDNRISYIRFYNCVH